MSTLPRFSPKRRKALEEGTYHKQFGKVRKATGEINTLDRLIRERGAFSEISGEPLVPKGHPRYHYQIFHLACKNEFPDLRLYDDNLLLSTPDEQVAWTERKWTLRDKSQWKHVFEKEAAMKRFARGVDETPENG